MITGKTGKNGKILTAKICGAPILYEVLIVLPCFLPDPPGSTRFVSREPLPLGRDLRGFDLRQKPPEQMIYEVLISVSMRVRPDSRGLDLS